MMRRAREVNDFLAFVKGNPEYAKFGKAVLDEFLLDQRKIRQRKERNEDPDSILLNRGGSGEDFWEKRLYPDQAWSEEMIREYRKSNWVHVSSPYDCSGQLFTVDIDVFNTPRGVIVYTFEAIDI